MHLPYPHSFPTPDEEVFLELVLCHDRDFPSLWRAWTLHHTFESINDSLLRLVPLIYIRMQRLGFKDEYYDRIKGVYRSAWVRNQRILSITKRIAALCADHHIPMLILKGTPLLLEVYRNHGARFLGDADILIPPKYGPQVATLLRQHSFRYGIPYAPDVHNPVSSIYQVIKETLFIGPGDIEADIHWNIFSLSHHTPIIDLFALRTPSSETLRSALWQSAVHMNIDGTPCLRLSNEHFLIHLMIHGSEGNTQRTLRWVVDALRVLEVFPIDWKVVAAAARQFGFSLEIFLASRYLKERWKAPIPAWFLEELTTTPFSRYELRAYSRYTNVVHEVRYSPIGNVPILWYAYWKHETNRSPLGFVAYLMRTYGVSSLSQMVTFIVRKYIVRLRALVGIHPPSASPNAPDALPLKESTSNMLYVTLGRSVSFLASLAVVMVMAAHVPRDVVGSYNFLMATLSIISLFTLPGMNTALVRAVAQGHEGSVWPMLRIRLRWGTLGAFATALIGGGFLLTGNYPLGWAFIISAPFVPFTDTFSTFAMNYWQGKKRFGFSALVTAAYFVALAFTSIPILLFSDNLVIIVAGIACAHVIVGALVFETIRRRTTGSESPDSLSLGFHLTAMQVLRTVSENLDRIFVWWLLGPIATAIHTFAATPVMKAFQLLPIGTITLPHLSAHLHTYELKRSILQKTGLLFLFTVPTAALGIAIAPFAYSIAFPNYPESVVYFQIMFTCIAFAPVGLLRAALLAFKKTRALYMSEIGTHTAKFVALLGLGIPFGLMGIAWSAPLIGAFEFVLLLTLFLRTSPDTAATMNKT